MRLPRPRDLAAALATAALAALPSLAPAATVRVPADAASIQEGVLAASPGDTVLVAPGEYRELVQMREGVVLLSEKGPAETVLVSPGLAESILDEVVVECGEGITRATVIEGFTIDGADSPGAGIRCVSASPTVRGNVIRNLGWGVKLEAGSDALVEGNEIHGCRSFGLLFVASSPELYRNTIRDNQPRGITISGKKSKPVIGGSPENGNRIFDCTQAVVNDSRNDVVATHNDWGWAITAEMEAEGWPSDITAIVDGNDWERSHRGRGKVDYRHWVKPEGVAPGATGDAAAPAGESTPRPRWLIPVIGALVLVGILVAVSRR